MFSRGAALVFAGAACLPDPIGVRFTDHPEVPTWVLVDETQQLARFLGDETFASLTPFDPNLALGWTCTPDQLGLRTREQGWIRPGSEVKQALVAQRWDGAAWKETPPPFGNIAGVELLADTPCLRLDERFEVLAHDALPPAVLSPIGDGYQFYYRHGRWVRVDAERTIEERTGPRDTVAAHLVGDALYAVTQSRDGEFVLQRVDWQGESTDRLLQLPVEYLDECGLQHSRLLLIGPPEPPIERLYVVTQRLRVLELTKTGTTWTSHLVRDSNLDCLDRDPKAVWLPPDGVLVPGIEEPRTVVSFFPSSGWTTEHLLDGASEPWTAHYLVSLSGGAIGIGGTTGAVLFRKPSGETTLVSEQTISSRAIGLIAGLGDGIAFAGHSSSRLNQWFEGYGLCRDAPSEMLPPLVQLRPFGTGFLAVQAPGLSEDEAVIDVPRREEPCAPTLR